VGTSTELPVPVPLRDGFERNIAQLSEEALVYTCVSIENKNTIKRMKTKIFLLSDFNISDQIGYDFSFQYLNVVIIRETSLNPRHHSGSKSLFSAKIASTLIVAFSCTFVCLIIFHSVSPHRCIAGNRQKKLIESVSLT